MDEVEKAIKELAEHVDLAEITGDKDHVKFTISLGTIKQSLQSLRQMQPEQSKLDRINDACCYAHESYNYKRAISIIERIICGQSDKEIMGTDNGVAEPPKTKSGYERSGVDSDLDR